MSSWQPIETAPKDGTVIDVWEFCHDPKWRPNPDEHGMHNGWRLTNVKWLDDTWKEYDADWPRWVPCSNEYYTISHWMPLPGPPEPTKIVDE